MDAANQENAGSAQLSANEVVAKAYEIERSLALAAPSSSAERMRRRQRTERVSREFLLHMAIYAAQHDGEIAGAPFDGEAALAALARVHDARRVADVLRTLAQRIEDDAAGRLATVADRAFGLFIAMKRLTASGVGATCRDLYEELTTLARATERPWRRRKRAAKRARTTTPDVGASEPQAHE